MNFKSLSIILIALIGLSSKTESSFFAQATTKLNVTQKELAQAIAATTLLTGAAIRLSYPWDLTKTKPQLDAQREFYKNYGPFIGIAFAGGVCAGICYGTYSIIRKIYNYSINSEKNRSSVVIAKKQ